MKLGASHRGASSGPLAVYAAALEGDAVANLFDSSVCTGVGKVAAAVALTRHLATTRPSWVLSFGLCGAYPRDHFADEPQRHVGLEVGALCLVESDALVDEGVEDEHGFRSLAELGLGVDHRWQADPLRTAAVAQRLNAALVAGATVSTCSANDERSRSLASRTRASVETMEGAAVASACAAFDVPWVQLRCVSNRTGDRSRAGWELQTAVATLHEAIRQLAGHGFA